MKSKIALFFFAACVAAPALAAKKAPEPGPWTREPDSFMGISFNKNLESSLPACPKIYAATGTMCREAPYQTYYRIQHGPEIGVGYQLGIMASNSAVDSFYLTTNPDRFEDLVNIFIKKYGEPSQRIPQTVKTKGGAEFQNELLLWKGKAVTIVITKYDGDINTTSASLQSNASTERKAQEKNSGATSGASKL